ncbi:hypothetical protein [Natronococcus roseus]|uniref:hypothetical protein n=1 Tax=Natronococcus roseus TaxID=1052014 RepID=UPI00374CD744
MDDSSADRDPIVSEGRYAIVDAADDESADYWFVLEGDDRRLPIADDELDDAATALSRFRNARSDPEGRRPESRDGVELTCQDCDTTWTYTGSDEHAACPNCETEVPLGGIGP